MKPRLSICLLILSLLSIYALAQEQSARDEPQRKNQDEETIKLNTLLVDVPVIVTDRDGKYIPNLKVRNFQIYEDDVRQSIETFSSVEAPFNVALIIDTSGSTRFRLEEIQGSALSFIDQLRADDRVMVVSFDSRIYVDTEFTTDRRMMRKAIFQSRTGGSTRLYDAVQLVMTERLDKVAGRKAVVLFTDGVDTASRLATALESIEMVEESNVLVYVVQYDTRNDVRGPVFSLGGPGGPRILRQGSTRGTSPYDYNRADKYLEALAERSGARLHKAETLTDVEQAFSLIAEELRHQYTLSYYPTNDKRDGSFRRIRVVVNRPNLAVRARRGYRAEDEFEEKDK